MRPRGGTEFDGVEVEVAAPKSPLVQGAGAAGRHGFDPLPDVSTLVVGSERAGGTRVTGDVDGSRRGRPPETVRGIRCRAGAFAIDGGVGSRRKVEIVTRYGVVVGRLVPFVFVGQKYYGAGVARHGVGGDRSRGQRVGAVFGAGGSHAVVHPVGEAKAAPKRDVGDRLVGESRLDRVGVV